MKYCVRYSRKFHYIDEVDEFKIIYKPNDDKLIEFLNLYSEKRIIISFQLKDMQDIVLSNALKEKYSTIENKNFTFLLPSINEENKKTISVFISALREYNIPFFFDDKVYSIDKVWELIEIGVSDIYICGELGFEIANIADKIHEANVKIRTFPDIAQSTRVSGESLTKFYIRPEDIEFYEDYIDVCEFFANDKTRDNVLYQIYAINKQWTNNIKDIIIDFNEEISNLSFPKSFGEVRTRCNKKCLKNGKCQICHRAKELSTVLTKNELHLKNT